MNYPWNYQQNHKNNVHKSSALRITDKNYSTKKIELVGWVFFFIENIFFYSFRPYQSLMSISDINFIQFYERKQKYATTTAKIIIILNKKRKKFIVRAARDADHKLISNKRNWVSFFFSRFIHVFFYLLLTKIHIVVVVLRTTMKKSIHWIRKYGFIIVKLYILSKSKEIRSKIRQTSVLWVYEEFEWW